MKLRIKGDSIRLRLTKSEIAQMGETGRVEETTHIGNASLIYRLQQSDTDEHISAEMHEHVLTVFMPAKWVSEWVNTDRVGFEHNMPLPNGNTLYLLLEKDFKCLDATNEDQSDMYENPMAEFHKK